MKFSVTYLIAVPIDTFFSVRVIISPTLTCVSASLRFIMFYSEFSICDVAPESAIIFRCHALSLMFSR